MVNYKKQILKIFLVMVIQKNGGEEMSKILVVADESIINKFLSEFAEENIVPLNKKSSIVQNNSLNYKNITLNKENYEVIKNGEKVFLTVREFEILKLLMENPKKVFTRDNLLNSIWSYDYLGDEKIINTNIKNIRKKLGNEIIKTIRGVGYKIE